MDWWHVGMVANGLIAIAYLLIMMGILVPLVRDRQLRVNALAGGTAAIFLTCAVHHGAHAIHMALPAFGTDLERGLAMRDAWGVELALWDVVGAAVGWYYYWLRRTDTSLTAGAKLFEDLRERERQALEINDNVLQGMAVAKMALELDRPEQARQALQSSITAASDMIGELLGSSHRTTTDGLLRSSAAVLHPPGGGVEATGQATDERPGR